MCPTGKVKFYDTEKGFGFLHQMTVKTSSCMRAHCPRVSTSSHPAPRVDFGIVDGKRGNRPSQ